MDESPEAGWRWLDEEQAYAWFDGHRLGVRASWRNGSWEYHEFAPRLPAKPVRPPGPDRPLRAVVWLAVVGTVITIVGGVIAFGLEATPSTDPMVTCSSTAVPGSLWALWFVLLALVVSAFAVFAGAPYHASLGWVLVSIGALGLLATCPLVIIVGEGANCGL